MPRRLLPMLPNDSAWLARPSASSFFESDALDDRERDRGREPVKRPLKERTVPPPCRGDEGRIEDRGNDGIGILSSCVETEEVFVVGGEDVDVALESPVPWKELAAGEGSMPCIRMERTTSISPRGPSAPFRE
jgi:hypothetical protein